MQTHIYIHIYMSITVSSTALLYYSVYERVDKTTSVTNPFIPTHLKLKKRPVGTHKWVPGKGMLRTSHCNNIQGGCAQTRTQDQKVIGLSLS